MHDAKFTDFGALTQPQGNDDADEEDSRRRKSLKARGNLENEVELTTAQTEIIEADMLWQDILIYLNCGVILYILSRGYLFVLQCTNIPRSPNGKNTVVWSKSEV